MNLLPLGQLHIYKDRIVVKIIANSLLPISDFDAIKSRIIKLVPGLSKYEVSIMQVNDICKTQGGKLPLIVNHT